MTKEQSNKNDIIQLFEKEFNEAVIFSEKGVYTSGDKPENCMFHCNELVAWWMHYLAVYTERQLKGGQEIQLNNDWPECNLDIGRLANCLGSLFVFIKCISSFYYRTGDKLHDMSIDELDRFMERGIIAFKTIYNTLNTNPLVNRILGIAESVENDKAKFNALVRIAEKFKR